MGKKRECTVCKIKQPLSEYYKDKRGRDGLRSNCKDCTKKTILDNYWKNPEIGRARRERYRQANMEMIKAQKKIDHLKNREKNLEYLRRWQKENEDYTRKKRKLYYKENKAALLAVSAAYRKKRYAEDPHFRLVCNIRRRVGLAITKSMYSEDTQKWVGCDFPTLIEHLESKFTKGMKWNNYGKWEVDHIFPVSKANLKIKREIKKVLHYTNLQPLWAEDNRRKSAKLNYVL